jgi:3-hydroxybutyryl-CoA dehydrogenase
MDKVVVVGSGVMGRGIAYVSALGGCEVTLVDVSLNQLKSAEQEIDLIIKKGVRRGNLDPEQGREAMTRLQFEQDLALAVREADLVIEAVPENMALKKQVFETLDTLALETCILATNTSTMSPTEIGSFTHRPHQVIAMHFFNPVNKMPLVEIIRGLETSDETARKVEHFAQKIGKETVIVNEFPGFVTSRISALVGNEAFYMLQEGVASPEVIDKAIKLGLNYPLGPFELADLVGLDARLNNLKYLHEKLGEKYRPAPLLEMYVKAGRLGRKSGRGVYDYSTNE